jgi:hypothetical protein
VETPVTATRQQHQAIIRDLHARLNRAQKELETLRNAMKSERELKNKWRMFAKHVHAELIAKGIQPTTPSPADSPSRMSADGARQEEST